MCYFCLLSLWRGISGWGKILFLIIIPQQSQIYAIIWCRYFIYNYSTLCNIWSLFIRNIFVYYAFGCCKCRPHTLNLTLKTVKSKTKYFFKLNQGRRVPIRHLYSLLWNSQVDNCWIKEFRKNMQMWKLFLLCHFGIRSTQ